MRQHGSRRRVRRAVSAERGRRGAFARTLLVVTLLANLLALPSPGAAFTTTTITIDADFSDWIGVRADPDNVVVDTQIPDDPDWPGQPDRDVYIVGTTYDEEYLYFSWRRTAGGTKAITFGAYLDYEGDGLLQDGDKVVVWTVSTGGPYASYTNGSADILHYHQAHDNRDVLPPEGDPMRDTHRIGVPTGDGETPDGWASRQDGYDVPLKTMDAYLSPNGDGIECEARVAWSDLGVEPGSSLRDPLRGRQRPCVGHRRTSRASPTRPSAAGAYLEENRGQVEDNIEPIMYLLDRGVTVAPDNSGGGTAGSTVTYYAHDHEQRQRHRDVRPFALSSLGWGVTITDCRRQPDLERHACPGTRAPPCYVNVHHPGRRDQRHPGRHHAHRDRAVRPRRERLGHRHDTGGPGDRLAQPDRHAWRPGRRSSTRSRCRTTPGTPAYSISPAPPRWAGRAS